MLIKNIMQLYMVRHGQSLANSNGLVTGSMEDCLTAEGIRQVQELKSQCNDLDFDGFYVSPWRRAIQTAEILYPNQQFTVAAELGETNGGRVAEWTNVRFKQVFPDYYSSFSPERPYCGGESHLDLYRRVSKWLDQLKRKHMSKVLVVCHAGPIACIYHRIHQIDMKFFPAWIPPNASVTLFEISDNV